MAFFSVSSVMSGTPGAEEIPASSYRYAAREQIFPSASSFLIGEHDPRDTVPERAGNKSGNDLSG